MATDTKALGWRRHFDGWQAGALVLLLASSAIILGVPKAATPELPPEPMVDGAALGAIMEADDLRAQRAVDAQLDHDIRALGQEIRHYNLAAAAGREAEFQLARSALLTASQKALSRSVEELLQLRAYQMLRFIDELAKWTATGEESEELRALGGDFVATLARNRWCRPGTRELVMSERELRVLFKKRWGDITALRGPSFDPSIDEHRVRFGFFLRQSFVPAVRGEGSARLKLVARLEELDPSYPADIARGVVMYQMGQYAPAGDQFRRHLEAHPDGPYTLLVTNYLKAALDLAMQDDAL